MANAREGSLPSVECPACHKPVVLELINQHLDRCVEAEKSAQSSSVDTATASGNNLSSRTVKSTKPAELPKTAPKSKAAPHPFFQSRSQKRDADSSAMSSVSKKSRTNIIQIDGSSSSSSSPTQVEVVIKPDPDGEPTPSRSTANDSTVGDQMNKTSISQSTTKVFGDGSKKKDTSFKPLAEIMRPSRLDNYVGQEDAVGERTLLRKLINSEHMPSIILWGPPGCGKTTLANIIANHGRERGTRFVSLSAVAAGIKEVKDVVTKAQSEQKLLRVKTVLFLDEIHRFNKSQQDVFLPYVENGTITLIGATTENPSFSLNSALLSRCKVIVLEKLSPESLTTIVVRALQVLQVRLVQDTEDLGNEDGLSITRSALDFIVGVSDGDSRVCLNSLQTAVDGFRDIGTYTITKEDIKDSLKKTHFLYDRKGDQHYDTISAFHKSLRFSKENAALYYLARMLNGGEDPRFIARRLMVFASEDIGVADPSMLSLAAATHQSCEKIGMPECRIMLAHCAVQFARAPKSRESYDAYGRAEMFIRNFEGPHPPVPLSIRNAPTKLMKELGYAKGEYGSCMPEGLEHVNFFVGDPPPHHK